MPSRMERRQERLRRRRREACAWIVEIAVVFVLAMLVRTFVFSLTTVQGPSMRETLHSGQIVAVDKLYFSIHDFSRGQIVICRYPDSDEFYDRLWRSELAGHNLHGRVACVAGMRIGGLGGVFRGQIWMPDGNPNYYSPATFMRRVGQGNIWRGGVPRRHRSTIFPSVYGNLQRQKADILVTHEAPSCHKKGFCALDRLAKTMGVKWLFHGHQHEDRAYGMQGLILTRAVGYNGIVNLKGEVVVEAKLDPREEAALQATDEWRYMSDKNPIIVRDEDGHISLVPEGRECTPAILPVSEKVLAKLKAAQEEGGKTPALEEKGRKAQKSEQGGAPQGVRKQGDEEKRGRSHRSSRSRSGRDRWRRAKKPSQQQQG